MLTRVDPSPVSGGSSMRQVWRRTSRKPGEAHLAELDDPPWRKSDESNPQRFRAGSSVPGQHPSRPAARSGDLDPARHPGHDEHRLGGPDAHPIGGRRERGPAGELGLSQSTPSGTETAVVTFDLKILITESNH